MTMIETKNAAFLILLQQGFLYTNHDMGCRIVITIQLEIMAYLDGG